MRGDLANSARNLAAHSDVITLHRAAEGYAQPMRTVMALLCSLLLLATLFGLAHSERSPHGVHADALHAQPLIPDALSREAPAHVPCQLVCAGEPVPVTLMAVAGSSHFEITPVMGSSRSLGPRTPPPRHLS